MRAVRIAVAMVAIAGVAHGCASRTMSGDAFDGESVDAFDVQDSGPPPVVPGDFVVSIVDETNAPLADVSVRAERRDGVFFEANTDVTGTVHFPFDVTAASWDITAARIDRIVWSVLGVDAPLRGAIELHSPIPPDPQQALTHIAAIRGTLRGLSDPENSARIDLVGGATMEVFSDTWSTTYGYAAPDAGVDITPVQIAAVEYDGNGRLVNGVLSPEYPRDGHVIDAVAIEFPAPPRAVHRADLSIALAIEGLLSARSTFQIGFTDVGRNLATPWLLGLSNVAPLRDGRFPWHVEWLDGDMLPTTFYAEFLVLQNGTWHAIVDRASVTDGETVRLPIVRVADVQGSTTDDALIEMDAEGAERALVVVLPPGRAPAWYGEFFHAERPVVRHMPHLPSSVALADVFGGDACNVALSVMADVRPGPNLAYGPYTPGILMVSNATPLAVESR